MTTKKRKRKDRLVINKDWMSLCHKTPEYWLLQNKTWELRIYRKSYTFMDLVKDLRAGKFTITREKERVFTKVVWNREVKR